MTGDYQEKYIRVNLDFVPMAGKLDQDLRAQRRLLDKLVRMKPTEDVKNLLVSVAGTIEETDKLIAWTHKMLTGVLEDAKALCDGAQLRNQLKWNGELLGELLDAKK